MKKFSDFFEQPKEKPKKPKNKKKNRQLTHKSTRRYDPNPTPTPKIHEYHCKFSLPVDPYDMQNEDRTCTCIYSL